MTDKMLSEAEIDSWSHGTLPFQSVEAADAFRKKLCAQAKLAIPKPRQDAGRVDANLKRALWNATEFTINRYLMANTHGRWDGSEKAQCHRTLCQHFISALLDRDFDRVDSTQPEYQAVHEGTQKLTGYLDQELGFPLDDPRPDYETLAPAFFEKFYALTLAALTLEAKPQTDNGGLVEALKASHKVSKEFALMWVDVGAMGNAQQIYHRMSPIWRRLDPLLKKTNDALAQADAKGG